MTTEEAIEVLKTNMELCRFNPLTGDTKPMNKECEELANAIDIAISALESQRWIPVSERLPAPGERVLCFVKAIGIVNNIHCNAMTVDYIGSNGGWIPVDEGYEFTHWMLLPQPPKEVE